ncbi:hypothetical protein LCGC14_1084440, partial [marine sediment metagenome]
VNFMVHRFLINKMLYKLYDHGPLSHRALTDCVYADDFDHKKPEWLINGTYFPFGKFFNLIKKDNQKRIHLTKLGKIYVESDKSRPKDISELQARIIRDWIISNPFKSKVVNGIYNVVESTLELMKNNEIVSDLDYANYFALKSGKFYEWKDGGTKKTQFSNYRNLSKELGLIETYDNRIYITPLGYKFIIQLQINRVREMVTSL